MPAHRRVACRPRDSNPDQPVPETGASAVGPERPGAPRGCAGVTMSLRCSYCSCYSCRCVVRVALSLMSPVLFVSLRCSYCFVSRCRSCRRNGRARTCGLPVPGRMLFLLSYAPSRVRAGWRGPYRTRRGPADRAGVATPVAESQSHAPLPRGQSRSGGSNPVLPGGSRLPYRFGLCGVSPGIFRGESIRALQGRSMNGFAFNVCCAVDLSRAGNGLPRMVGEAVSPGAGNEEAAWNDVSGGSVVSLAGIIHLAIRGSGHYR